MPLPRTMKAMLRRAKREENGSGHVMERIVHIRAHHLTKHWPYAVRTQCLGCYRTLYVYGDDDGNTQINRYGDPNRCPSASRPSPLPPVLPVPPVPPRPTPEPYERFLDL